jgi:hypothetical protein
VNGRDATRQHLIDSQVLRKFSLFVMELLLHLGCGLVISIAAQVHLRSRVCLEMYYIHNPIGVVKRLEYVGSLPAPACVLGPLAQYNSCRLPQSDDFASIGNFLRCLQCDDPMLL